MLRAHRDFSFAEECKKRLVYKLMTAGLVHSEKLFRNVLLASLQQRNASALRRNFLIEGGSMQMPAKKACKSQAIKAAGRASRAEPNLVGAVEENTPKTVAVAASGRFFVAKTVLMDV